MTTRFIFNPISGRNRRDKILRLLQQHRERPTFRGDLVITEGVGHATELAAEAVAQNFHRIVAVGGDGTMNEVAQALVHSASTLALVPCGSGNGLALHLGVPTSLEAALALACDPDAATAVIDTGSANSLPFFNAMGVGLDAEVSRRFNLLAHRGLPSYIRTVVSSLRNFRPEKFQVWCDGKKQSISAALICIANSDQYGNNARIAPGALVNDGVLDLVIVEPVSLFPAVGLATRLFAGTLNASTAVQHYHGRHFVIERATAGVLHTDGETHWAAARVEISILPQSLRIAVPLHSRAAVTPPIVSHEFALQLP